MNTPAHLALNLVCLGRQEKGAVVGPVALGAFLPDGPMFLFYFVEKAIFRHPEAVIWGESYFNPHWQNFIDVFNSLPLIAIAALTCWWGGSSFGVLLSLSMALHVFGDLPLHHDDGHRHLFPFSDWRFESPVSYWDPQHFGAIAAPIEVLAALVMCGVLFRCYRSWKGRLIPGLIMLCYLLYLGFALVVWVN